MSSSPQDLLDGRSGGPSGRRSSPAAFAVCRLPRGNRLPAAPAVCRLPRGNRLPAAPARTAAHVGLDVRIARIEPSRLESVAGEQRQCAQVAMVRQRPAHRRGRRGLAYPQRGRPLAQAARSGPAASCGARACPRSTTTAPPKPASGGDSRQIHAGIAHRMVGAIRGCSVTAPAPVPQIAHFSP
jgi:hypothetical protein